jgi:hypothetical protein
MNQELIKQLREGKIAVRSDGTVEEIRQVIKEAFPFDKTEPSGQSNYYRSSNLDNNNWMGGNITTIPYYSVKEFLKEKEFVLPEKWAIKGEFSSKRNNRILSEWFSTNSNNCWAISSPEYFYFIEDNNCKRVKYLPTSYTEITFEQFKKYVLKEEIMGKKIIGYRLVKREYEKAVIAVCNWTSFNFKRFESDISDEAVKRLTEAGVLDLWFEPVSEEEIKLPIINGYTPELNGEVLVYGCAKFSAKNTKKLIENVLFFNDPDQNLIDLGANKKIVAITLDGGYEVRIENLKQIYKYLNAKGL